MSPLQRAIEWLEAEKPCKEEIQQSVDNLCHQRARPPSGITEAEIDAAIKHLMAAAGGSIADLVLPDTQSRMELDYSPLVSFDDVVEHTEETPEERRKRFKALQVALLAPF